MNLAINVLTLENNANCRKRSGVAARFYSACHRSRSRITGAENETKIYGISTSDECFDFFGSSKKRGIYQVENLEKDNYILTD